jgi:haloalkane dehalogenase
VDRVLRTPDERFAHLPGFDFEPRYADIVDDVLGQMRMHYVEAGPVSADPVLLVHGQPTWSYLWRHVIRSLAERGHRVVVPDLIGFGRSDKPARRTDHTVADQVAWLHQFIERLDLIRVTLVAHDWGGPIGLSVLAAVPGRFARVVATNTILHTADATMADDLNWADHEDGHGHMVLQQELVEYILLTQRLPQLEPSLFVRFATAKPPDDRVLAAYDAPFPDESYAAGPRQLPVLIPLTPNDPGAAVGRNTWEVLRGWDRPFLTAYSDGDPASRGWDRVFQERVPGAKGLDHVTIAGAGHFLQEDRSRELAAAIDRLVESTPSPFGG